MAVERSTAYSMERLRQLQDQVKDIRHDPQLTDYQRHRQIDTLTDELMWVSELPPYPIVDLPEIDKGHVMYPGMCGRHGWLCILRDRHEWCLWGSIMVCSHCNLHHRECRCPGEHCRMDESV